MSVVDYSEFKIERHIKNSYPPQFLLQSALIHAIYQQLETQNKKVSLTQVLALLVRKMESEPNEILADLYQQAIHQILNVYPEH